MLEQVLGAGAVSGQMRDADRRADLELGAVEHERVVERLQDLLGDGLGAVRVQARADEHELVAAEPGEQVAGARDVADPARHLAEHLVAGGVPERVVDELEVVEVEVERATSPPSRAARARSRASCSSTLRAVRQAGQRVVVGEVGESRL